MCTGGRTLFAAGAGVMRYALEVLESVCDVLELCALRAVSCTLCARAKKGV